MTTALLTRPVQGRVDEDGHVKLSGLERGRFDRQVTKLVGKAIELVIRKKREQRTLPQNSYIHSVIAPIMSEFMGQGIAETKLDLMGECWGYKQSALGHPMPEKPSTAEMNKEECIHFIDWVVPWALTTYNVVIPLPHEADWGEAA